MCYILSDNKGQDMRIYFDMDGVLAHFDAMRPNDTNLNHPSEELSPEMRALKTQFWLDIERDKNFWANIPVMANIEQLLNVAKSYGELFVLSKTPGAKHFNGGDVYVAFVADEKRKWILKHLNKFFDAKHTIICKGKKGELIHPTKTDILIDDRQENIDEWNAHGGTGILFTNAINTTKILQNL